MKKQVLSTLLSEYQVKGIEGIAEEFDCSKSKVLRVAVSTLFYFLHEEQGGRCTYFHIQRKLSDKDY